MLRLTTRAMFRASPARFAGGGLFRHSEPRRGKIGTFLYNFAHMQWYMGSAGLKGMVPWIMFVSAMMSGVYFNNINKAEWYDKKYKRYEIPEKQPGDKWELQPWQVIRDQCPNVGRDGSGPAELPHPGGHGDDDHHDGHH